MNIEFKLRSFISLSVISGILVSVGVIAWNIYSRLQETILDGFDRKLSAVSTVTASFIDARTHERILAPRIIDGLAFDADSGCLYGADSSFGDNTIVRIDLADGSAEAVAFLDVEFLPISLAAGEKAGHLLGVVIDEDGTSQLVEIDTQEGSAEVRFELPEGSAAVAVEGGNHLIYVGGKNGLHRIDRDTGEAILVEETRKLRIDELTFAGPGKLIAFDDQQSQLFEIDPVTGGSEKIPFEEGGGLKKSISALASNQKTGVIYSATDRLIKWEPGNSKWDEAGMVAGFRSEKTDEYLRYVKPMREIKRRNDLTFLYTQTLSDSHEVRFNADKRLRADRDSIDEIIYVIDANLDDDHSPIGLHDAGNEADEAIRDVFFKAKLHLSDIEEWERWGLIKSGFAPISDPGGHVVGMAGADVRVEKIREKTKLALVKVTLTAFGALLVASVASFFVSRKLTEPINELKDVALRIAAGDYGKQINPPNLLELTRLSETFNSMSATLEQSVKGLQETNRNWEKDRRHYELIRHMTLRSADLDSYGAWVELLTSGPAHLGPSGWTNRDKYVIGWIAEDKNDPVENLRFRVGLAGLFYQLIGAAEGDWELIKSTLESLIGDAISVAFFLDLKDRRIEFSTCGDPVIWRHAPDGDITIVEVTDAGVPLPRGHEYVLCGHRRFAEQLSRWAENEGDDLVSKFQIELGDEKSAGGSASCGIAVKLGGAEGGEE